MALLKVAFNVPEEWRRQVGTKELQYGTAGFRDKVEVLPHVMFRMGLLAGLRAVDVEATVGVMITASHNPDSDNGVKIVDPMGNMLDVSFEPLATELVNLNDEDLEGFVKRIVNSKSLERKLAVRANVVCGYDTRRSSPTFQEAVRLGVEALGIGFSSVGSVTTPQLHYVVRCTNDIGYGEPTEEGYYEKLASAYRKLNKNIPTATYQPKMFVDAANGVGGGKMISILERIGDLLDVKVVNRGEGKLNQECGADFVKIHQKVPVLSDGSTVSQPEERWASFDGDGDRIIYFFIDNDGQFRMLDGDKICVMIAGFLKDLLDKAGLGHVKLGVVQTAYANGRSTSYVQKVLNVSVVCASTGVKNLHHEAEKLPIGVYFEANGHGTVLFNPEFLHAKAAAENDTEISEERKYALEQLSALMNLINETVGDAISDLLVVETVLRQRDWSHWEWDALYRDLPQRQLKVNVKDRFAIVTTDAERRVEKPEGLQDKVDDLVRRSGTEARSFVRPSGTEDIVRVYAEALTQEEADALAHSVAQIVTEMCN